MPTQLIYIHGFNSSPLSLKAGQLRQHVKQLGLASQLSVPALPFPPDAAMQQLQQLIEQYQDVALVGSSLGGFYASWLAQQYDLKAVLINPAVNPWKLLDKSTAIQHNYHTGEAWELQPAWVQQLKQYAIDKPAHPNKLLLMTQTGDDTLDWRDGWELYRDCHLFRGLGGSHGFDNFDSFIPFILRFCGLGQPLNKPQ